MESLSLKTKEQVKTGGKGEITADHSGLRSHRRGIFRSWRTTEILSTVRVGRKQRVEISFADEEISERRLIRVDCEGP